MKSTEKTLLNRLLAGSDGLAPADKAEVLDAVFRALPAENKALRWFELSWVRMAALGVALASVSLWVFVRAPLPSAGELTVRDGARPTLAIVQRGDHLLFKTTASAGRSLTVVAHTASGDTLWYLENVTAPAGVIDQAVLIEPSHPRGELSVDAVFTPAPVSRARALEYLERTDEPASVIRIHQVLVIAP